MRPLLVLGALALAAHPLSAADHGPEYALALGCRSGMSLDPTSSDGAAVQSQLGPSWGLSASWWVRPDGWFEVLFDRQTLRFDSGNHAAARPFDVSVDYLQFGGGYEPPREGLKPYVTVAIGLGGYGSDPGSTGYTGGLSGSIGGGFKVPMGPKGLFRLEARGWAALAYGDMAVTCGPGCSFTMSGEGLWQVGVRAAFGYRPHGAR